MPHATEGILHAYLDGALPALEQAGELPDGQAAADVEAHLAACADCRALLEAERAVREAAGVLLAHAAPVVDVPPFETVAGPARRRAFGRWLPLAWAASLLLAVGAGWWAAQLGDAGAARELAVTRGDQPTQVAAEPAARPRSDAPAGAAAAEPVTFDAGAPAEATALMPSAPPQAVGRVAAGRGREDADHEGAVAVAATTAAATTAAPAAEAPTARPLEQVAAAPAPPVVTRQAPSALQPPPRQVEEVARPQAGVPAAAMPFRAHVLEVAPATVPESAPPADVVALLGRSAVARDWTPVPVQEAARRTALPLLTVDGAPPAAVAYRMDPASRAVVRVTQDVAGAGAVELLVWAAAVPHAGEAAAARPRAGAPTVPAAPHPMGTLDDGDERQLVVRLPGRDVFVAIRGRLTAAELQDLAGRLTTPR